VLSQAQSQLPYWTEAAPPTVARQELYPSDSDATSSNVARSNTSSTATATPNRILGEWRPVSVRYDPEGENRAPYGQHPAGLLVFTENGRFIEVLHNPDLPRFAAETRDRGTPAENAAAMAGANALYGTYIVDDAGDFYSQVVQGSTFPNWNGLERRRPQLTLTVNGDRMMEDLRDPNRPRVVIEWERVR
jgi:hypothetical protein